MNSSIDLDVLAGWMDDEGLGSGPLTDVTALEGELKMSYCALFAMAGHMSSGEGRRISARRAMN